MEVQGERFDLSVKKLGIDLLTSKYFYDFGNPSKIVIGLYNDNYQLFLSLKYELLTFSMRNRIVIIFIKSSQDIINVLFLEKIIKTFLDHAPITCVTKAAKDQ